MNGSWMILDRRACLNGLMETRALVAGERSIVGHRRTQWTTPNLIRSIRATIHPQEQLSNCRYAISYPISPPVYKTHALIMKFRKLQLTWSYALPRFNIHKICRGFISHIEFQPFQHYSFIKVSLQPLFLLLWWKTFLSCWIQASRFQFQHKDQDGSLLFPFLYL